MTSITTPQLAALTSSAPVAPVQLQLGQILGGTVIALLDNALLRLQTPAGLLDVAADTPLPAGTSVTITVQSTSQQPQLVITPVTDATRQPVPQQAAAAIENSGAQIRTSAAETDSPAPLSANPSAADTVELTNPQSAAASAAPSLTPTASSTPQTPIAPALTQSAVSQPALTQSGLTQAALSTATAIVRDAATAQGSLASLYADIEAAVAAPTPSLPAPVLDAARLLLAARFDVASSRNMTADNPNAALLRTGLASAVAAPETSIAAAADLGPALIALRQALKNWLDQQTDTAESKTASAPANPAAQTPARSNSAAPSYRGLLNLPALPNAGRSLNPALLAITASLREPAAHLLLSASVESETTLSPSNPDAPQTPARAAVPMPPYRGAPSEPQAPVPPSLATTAPPREQATHLLSQADAAIARQTLLRIVSLSSDPTSSMAHSNDNATRVMFEIPVVTAQGTGVAPMTIERDGRHGNGREGSTSWLAKFSIDLPGFGPVHVRVALTGERATVMLNAERAESAALLAAGLPLLDAGLRSAQIEPGELRCHGGKSNANSTAETAGAARRQVATPGLFLDQAS